MRFLIFLSGIWRFVVRIRNWAYDKGILKSVRVGLPIFSVGNIAVGGTGKTPLVLLLTQELQEVGPLAIVTRGFKSQIEKRRDLVQISSGQGPLFSVEECGDEPFFLANESSASVWVGPNRVLSAQQALKAGAACVILDDGMQHRRLKRDVEIVLVDGSDPLAQGLFLPAGRLRDLPERLKEADLIVATHTRNHKHYQKIQEELSCYTAAPLVGMCYEPINPSVCKDKKVGAFCGIANPNHFHYTLKALGAEVIEKLNLSDHQPISEEELISFVQRSYHRGAELIVCTEKDWVKLPKYKNLALPIFPIKVRLKIISGKERWDLLIKTMKQRVRR